MAAKGDDVKEFGGWKFPDHELHLIEWMKRVNDLKDGRLRYQGKKQDAAISWCTEFRTAIDVGAHVGLWSYYLARQFTTLHSFEPVAAHRECFGQNLGMDVTVGADGLIFSHLVRGGGHDCLVDLHACALGERDASIAISTETGSSGNSFVSGAGDIPLRRLDDLHLEDVDFIKLDCEGGELPALRGGEETLKRCRPCIIVEQKPGRAQKFGLEETGAVDYLRGLGAYLRTAISGDYILSWD